MSPRDEEKREDPVLDKENVRTSSIEDIVSNLKSVRSEAEALGLFTGDRELLACTTCGLLEDVLADGRLVTCREESLGQDTGLRFVEAEAVPGRFVCPACGNNILLRVQHDG
jgi:hypothetical protein